MSLQRWQKLGRIFQSPGDAPWNQSHAAVPIADRLSGGRFRIYYSSRDSKNRSHIAYFEIDLSRPAEIVRRSVTPVIGPGPAGTFDDAGAMCAWLTNYGSRKYLYYIGWNLGVSVPFRNAIGLAVSDDGGQTFTKRAAGPVADRGPHDPCFTASSCVLVENGVWRMWYLSCVRWDVADGQLRHYYHIKYAESDDGVNWRRDGRVCIDFATADEYAISRPCVLRDSDRYCMWYSYRGDRYRIGYAESEDGLTWERMDSTVGLDVSAAGWDAEMIEYPYVFEHGGARYMLYNGNGYGATGIGLAVLT